MTVTITTDPRRWYCLRTATRQEKAAVQKLREHFTEALIEGGVTCDAEIYLPVEKRRSKLRRVPEGTAEEDAYEVVERPLMQGYVFIKTASAEAAEACVPDREAEVAGVEFIHAVLNYRNRAGRLAPFPIASSIIEGLMNEEATGNFDYTPRSKRYRPGKGDRVLIIKGPFIGYLAEVIATTADERRVVLEMPSGTAQIKIDNIEAAA